MATKYAKMGAMILAKSSTPENKNYYIKKDKEFFMKINGALVDGDYINVQKPIEKLNFLLSKGYIDQDEFDKRASQLNDYDEFEVSVKVAGKNTVIGFIRKSEDGSRYIKLDEKLDFNFNGLPYNRKSISAEKPQDKYYRFAEKGIITEVECEEKIASIPSYVKLEFSLPLDS